MTSSKNYKYADRTAPGHEQNIQYIATCLLYTMSFKKSFPIHESEFDDNLFFHGQIYQFDEAYQQLPAGKGRVRKLLHQ